MNNVQVLSAFNQLNTSALPDVHSLQHERLQIFWVLCAAKGQGALDTLTASQISMVLRDCCGVAISRQRVAAILSREGDTVAKRKLKGRQHFKLMKAGEDTLASSAVEPVFIDPAQALSNIRKVEDILGSLKGEVLVCDPYVDNRTLDFLAACSDAASIKLLTVNVYRQSRFKRDLRAFGQEHGQPLEVRVFCQGELHDRYIIHDGGMLLLGASLNGLGMKQSFIVALGDDIRNVVERAFKKAWTLAKTYP